MPAYETFKSGPRQGQPRTLTDRVIRYLVEKENCTEQPSRSRYRCFKHPNQRLLFVGQNGAVRVGKNASNSVSITDRTHRLMKQWELTLPSKPASGLVEVEL